MCHNFGEVAQKVKALTIREARAALTRLEEVLRREGEVVVTRRGRPIARLLPIRGPKPVPSHADLRAATGRLTVRSEVLVRADRDAR